MLGSVSGAGDVNGDGIDDLIVGVPFANPLGQTDAGQAVVIFGGSHLTTSESLDLRALAPGQGLVMNGSDVLGRVGYSVSGAGDVNGDGIDDLIVGAPYVSPLGRANAGQAVVVFGGSSLTMQGSVDLGTLSSNQGWVLNGARIYDDTGWSVSGAGDVNGDGVADLIVGVPHGGDPRGLSITGQAGVLFGQEPTRSPTVTWSPTTPFPTFSPTTHYPTTVPTTVGPTQTPVTAFPTTVSPTHTPTTTDPTGSPTTVSPVTMAPTRVPTSAVPTETPITTGPSVTPSAMPSISPQTMAPSITVSPSVTPSDLTAILSEPKTDIGSTEPPIWALIVGATGGGGVLLGIAWQLYKCAHKAYQDDKDREATHSFANRLQAHLRIHGIVNFREGIGLEYLKFVNAVMRFWEIKKLTISEIIMNILHLT